MHEDNIETPSMWKFSTEKKIVQYCTPDNHDNFISEHNLQAIRLNYEPKKSSLYGGFQYSVESVDCVEVIGVRVCCFEIGEQCIALFSNCIW